MSSKQQIKEMIDRLVAESIRRQLPEIMSEVLLRTIANSGIVQESRQQQRQQAPKQRKPADRPSSLMSLIDESVGADRYDHSEPRLTKRMSDIPNMPSHLAELLEDVDPIDHGGRGSTDEGVDVDGLDLSGIKERIAMMEGSARAKAPDKSASLQFEEQRLRNKRLALNGGKPLPE